MGWSGGGGDSDHDVSLTSPRELFNFPPGLYWFFFSVFYFKYGWMNTRPVSRLLLLFRYTYPVFLCPTILILVLLSFF